MKSQESEACSSDSSVLGLESFAETLLGALSYAVVGLNRNSIVSIWNPAAERMFGWSAAEVLGKPCPSISPQQAELNSCLLRALEEGTSAQGEALLQNKQGSSVSVQYSIVCLHSNSGKPVGVMALYEDITEKKQLEAQFLRSQRLENVGRLVSGIAHDLNNILAPILMAVPMLREEMTSEGNRRLLDTMESSALRGASIVKQVLAFGRGIAGQRAPLQLRHLLREMTQIIRETFPKSITLRVLCPHDLWTVIGDATQLHQVLMNLCVNARDAMPQGGTLTLRLDDVTLDEGFAQMIPEARPGPYVRLSVQDTGTGITPEIHEKIFEPFFTTKEAGKGTGLGLATVQSIVKNHDGFIQLNSEVGQGTTFQIYLPAVLAAPAQKTDVLGLAPLPGHGEAILVVDDEPAVRVTSQKLLEAHGYQVSTASDGAEGLREFLSAQERGEPFQAVVTDIVMPHMTGIEVLKQIKAMSPTTVVVLTSGYSREIAEAQGMGHEDSFIEKPFQPSDFVRAVAKAVADFHGKVPLATPVQETKEDHGKSALPSKVTLGSVTIQGQDTDARTSDREQKVTAAGVHEARRAPVQSRVLIVDDEWQVGKYLQKVVADAGYLVRTVSSGTEAVKVAPAFRPEVVLVDYFMPDMNGIQTVQSLRPLLPDTPMVLVTGLAEVEVVASALREMMFDFLLKPVTTFELIHCLRRAIEHRETQLRARRQENLLFVISHELRSPLQAPLRFIGNFLSGAYGKISLKQRNRLERVALGINTESRLVNNLVNLTYLESGRFQSEIARCSITAAVEEVVSAFELRAEDLKVRLLWERPQDPCYSLTDVDQVKQAISNLVSNALEHSPQGKDVKVTLRLLKAKVCCAVRDDGDGISAEDCKRIFERGYQVPSSNRRSRKGLGIGLFIAQEIAKALGGIITVKTKVGQGATFTLTLPVSQNSKYKS